MFIKTTRVNKNLPMHFEALPYVKSKAKILRRKSTPAENRFWIYVRNRRMNGFKFRRQHPIGNFIADFYCHELKLVVEIDGSIHELHEIKIRDMAREKQIKQLGLTVIRFTNSDVLYNPDFVELTLLEFIGSRRDSI